MISRKAGAIDRDLKFSMKSAGTRVDEVGLKRTYEAVEGNWASFIYIPGEAVYNFRKVEMIRVSTV